MENITINVVNTIGDVYGVEADDGQKVFELISKAFGDRKKVTLSFQNIEMLTTAFLNTAVGQLYKDFSELEIREQLKVSDISNSGKVALKRVVDTAKLYYKDPEAMQRSINEILGH
ncbi:STAS-like domain-containing protein [Cognataquiflexum rubidum]|uniref:STAS-like domain-containing protein n=1 Tax=Cognataquiflexum rubidum TaxID=2922273 RepID=UPI001F137683|nr:STAS-like domain-containing protein [Cognataquiflexum rubidum]MCH6236790.1 STAS-like domain-containing protein [Cognataquiflexum rubidum]